MDTLIDTQNSKIAFDAATQAFATGPNTGNLLLLTMAAQAMMRSSSVVRFSKGWKTPATGVEFNCIRLTTDRQITEDEVKEVTGALNYAMVTYVGVPELAPTRVVHGLTYTILEYDTDSRDRRRTDPDYSEAFAEAARYIDEGSPVRKTNRAGVGTLGTRLCKGIGSVGLKVEVYPAA